VHLRGGIGFFIIGAFDLVLEELNEFGTLAYGGLGHWEHK